MRAPFLLLPIAFTTLASMPAVAQEAPRVIFCTGPCFAVDQDGVRTPAPKGTTLREGQRLETGPSAYAQLKLGSDAAVGVGERARVRFDQTGLRDRDVVILDQGRIRMVGGEALGKAATRGVELRTFDGIFALRNADIEVKTSPPLAGGTDASFTVVKLNAGDARLLNPQGDIAITKASVQGVTAGKIVTDRPISVADVALQQARPGDAATTAAVAPIQAAPVSNMPVAAPLVPGLAVRPDTGPVVSLPGVPLTRPIPQLVPLPPVTRADQDLKRRVIDPTTGNPASLDTALRNAITVTTLPAITPGVGTMPALVTQPPLLSGTKIDLSPIITPVTTPIQTITPILTPGITTTLPKLTLMPAGR
jgi:hypothetical protein